MIPLYEKTFCHTLQLSFAMDFLKITCTDMMRLFIMTVFCYLQSWCSIVIALCIKWLSSNEIEWSLEMERRRKFEESNKTQDLI
jgi:hypothetical protein